MSTSPTTPTVNVPVTSAWSSKVNWTQAVAAAAMILTLVSGGKIGITPEQQAAAVVTISIGIACAIPAAESSPEALLLAADVQLYEAKRAGRNRSHSAES